MPILLTDEERDKFATYLEEHVASTKGIIEEMKKLPNMDFLIKKFQIEMSAEIIVANGLRATHSETI